MFFWGSCTATPSQMRSTFHVLCSVISACRLMLSSHVYFVSLSHHISVKHACFLLLYFSFSYYLEQNVLNISAGFLRWSASLYGLSTRLDLTSTSTFMFSVLPFFFNQRLLYCSVPLALFMGHEQCIKENEQYFQRE